MTITNNTIYQKLKQEKKMKKIKRDKKRKLKIELSLKVTETPTQCWAHNTNCYSTIYL